MEAAMDKVRWGVLGTAGIAKGQTIPGMKQAQNCELYAIAGRSMKKAKAYQEEFGFEKVYDDYDQMLADPNVEAVYIPLPNELHHDWAIKALKAKKHVLCEKPLAPTPEEAQEMISCAKENGVFLMEAFAYLHSPYISALKEVVDSGVIGDICYIESAFITSDYDVSNIRMRRETFGGALYDLGCYNTSLILWLLGEEPEKVQACAEFSDRNVDSLTTAVLTFAGGKRAAFTCGMVLPTEMNKRLDRLQFHVTKGKIISEVEFNQEGECSFRVVTEEGTEVKTVTARQNYALETEQLGRCILNGETPYVSNEFTMMNSRVLDRLLKDVSY